MIWCVCIYREVCHLFFVLLEDMQCNQSVAIFRTNSIFWPLCGFDSGVGGISSNGKHLKLWCAIRTVESWISLVGLKSGVG